MGFALIDVLLVSIHRVIHLHLKAGAINVRITVLHVLSSLIIASHVPRICFYSNNLVKVLVSANVQMDTIKSITNAIRVE